MAMGSKSNVQTSWNSSNNTHLCIFSGRRKATRTSGGCMLKLSESDSTYCTTSVLFISIVKNVLRDTIIINRTISIFRNQTFDSMLKWFTSLIQTYSINIFSKSQQQHVFPFATFSCSAPWQGSLTLLCNQHGRNVTSSTRVASC